MAKQSYAARVQDEVTPIRNGRQYRAQEVKVIQAECTGCVAKDDKALCEALPPCGKWRRLSGNNVVFVDCGPTREGGAK